MSDTRHPDETGLHEAAYMHTALVAIVARVRGEWDNPELEAFGPLSADIRDDILRIALDGLDRL